MRYFIAILFSFLLLAPGLYAARIDLSKASLMVSGSIQSPVRETVVRMLQEEISRRTQIKPSLAEQWRGNTVIALVLSADKDLSGIDLPWTAQNLLQAEGFSVSQTRTGGRDILWLSGTDERGVLFAAGYLLRTATLSKGKFLFDTQYAVNTAPEYPLRGHQLGYRNTSSSYDAWTKVQYEQYIRELAIFGTNSIETIPFDKKESPVMKTPKEEMNHFISDVCRRYGLQYWVWTPAEGDLSNPEYYASELRRHSEFYRKCPRLDGVFIPGGDPGSNHPQHLMPFLKELAAELQKNHPLAGIWLSLQGFSDEQTDYFFHFLSRENPDWLAGVVSGPGSPPLAETRYRLPSKYRHRHYADITHTVRCQYPTPNWDQAYALTLGREPANPEPFRYAAVHNRYAPFTDGFITYSDGAHDDLNKIVWSRKGWDSREEVNTIVGQYVRFFFGTPPADRVADAVLALENNWKGPIEANGGIELAFMRWQQLEKTHPQLHDNWRWQMLVLRAYYDTYIRRRKAYEQELEKQACEMLGQAAQIGIEEAMTQALAKVNEAERINPSIDLRKKIEAYCEALYRSVGHQTSVANYGASGAERGCILDFVDYPLNNRWWLADEFDKVRKMPSSGEQTARLEIIRTWEHPGKGSYYDNISNIAQSPHVTTTVDDACDVAWWNSGMSRKRLSTQLYQNFPKLVYDDLDPDGRYLIRIAGYGEALLRIDGVRIEPVLYNKGLEEFKEFPVDRKYVSDGKLEISFDEPEESHLNWRQHSKVCDIWLIKREPADN